MSRFQKALSIEHYRSVLVQEERESVDDFEIDNIGGYGIDESGKVEEAPVGDVVEHVLEMVKAHGRDVFSQ